MLTKLFHSMEGTADAAFTSIDKNGDGALSLDELMDAINKSGAKEWPRARISYIVAMINEGKLHEKGKLDLTAFKRMLSYLERGQAVQKEMEQAYRTIETLNLELESLRQRGPAMGGGGGGSVSAAAPDQWTTVAWLESVGLAACVASSLLADEDMANQLGAMRTLGQKSEAELVALMQENGTLQRLAGRLRPKLQELAAEAPTESVEAEVMSKFSGQIELSYGGLDSFFGGLEARIGAPQPKVAEAIEAEHTAHAESKAPFRTSNYGIETTTETEWLFVCAPDFDHALSRLGRPRWPDESSEIVRDRSRCRQPQPLERFVKAAEALNRELERTHQPAIIREEIVAARLYTGPLFEKYNAVLRGVSTSSPFLRSQLLRLCAPPGTHDEYQKGAKGEVDGAWSAALAQCQLFVTTLHGINSAVVKTGKLTKATKVYRGISGKALPAEFWKPNEFGVMGGVENGFMSTTTDRSVAAGYAASGGVGIVFEVQQGMVDRGADISWLSQYPHEREILFGPLTGLEAQHKSVEGGVVVIHARLSINLNALTLEAVISKKRKVLLDMGAAMRVEVRDQLVARGDGHYDAQGRPIKCHRSTMLPIVGERYEHQTDGYSLCAAEFGNVKEVGYANNFHKEPGRNEFVRVGVGPCWGAHAEEAAARGRLVEAAVRCLALGLPASWFNDDENFRQAVNTALELKRAVMASGLTHLELDLAPLWLLKELPAELSAVGALQSLKFVASDKFKALPSMAAPLRSGGQLRSLDLSGLEMGPANCVRLAQALSTATTLTALNLRGNSLCQGWTDRAAQLRWGAVRGPKIEVAGDGRTVTDIAANPKTGDDSGGRYRPCVAEQGFSSGVHRWGVRVLGRGRTLVGISTGKVTGEWREGSKRSLHQVKEAWTVCPPSAGEPMTNKWHAGKYAATGLPPLPVGGKLEVLLDCEARTVAFLVDGQAGDKEHLRAHMFLDLPAGETFFPAIAFGGDDVRGASFELCGYETIGLDLSGVEALAAALRGAASLTSVELHDNGLTDAAVAQLQEAAAVHKIKLGLAAQSQLRWGAVRGPKIEVTGDGRTVTDIAANPKTGDDSGGRYRPCVAEQGFSSGFHRWSVRVLERGRTLVGICTGKVTGEWREGSKRSLHQVKEAWTVCLTADGSGIKKWHANGNSETGLPPLPVGGKLEVLLDCEARTVAFLVNGQAGGTKGNIFLELPAGEIFFPVVCFGGDDVRGASFKLE